MPNLKKFQKQFSKRFISAISGLLCVAVLFGLLSLLGGEDTFLTIFVTAILFLVVFAMVRIIMLIMAIIMKKTFVEKVFFYSIERPCYTNV